MDSTKINPVYENRNNNHLSVLKFHESMLLRCFLITSLRLRSVVMLVDSNRIPEVALMARSYLPSKVSEIIKDGCLESFANKEADLDELTRSHKESYNCNDVYELLGNSACWTYLLNTILQMDLRWQNTVATIAYLLTKKVLRKFLSESGSNSIIWTLTSDKSLKLACGTLLIKPC
ncbi:hypothetical protein Tco_1148635 [Tanacetum coccineum]